MPNIDTLPPPTTNQVDPDLGAPTPQRVAAPVRLSGEIKEQGVIGSLISSVRDAFFAPKLPPLVLQSKPVAVPDRMATKRSPASTAFAVGVHVVIILLVALFIANQVKVMNAPKKDVSAIVAAPPPPPIAPKLEQIGGGGGQHDLAPVSKGKLPDFAQKQIVPPKAPPMEAPKLAIVPNVVVQKDLNLANNQMPNLGMPNSSLRGVSLGNGTGTGIGSGNGSGIGPGSGGNTGGGVSRPVVLYQVEPEFSEEARKAKFSGNVEVYIWVDTDGKPSHIRVVRGVGMGLDEKAVEAVRQYRFKPAMKDGKPVQVDLYIDVNFQIL
jgi:protein TonB